MANMMFLFVLQWLLWGLEWSSEDHICFVRGPCLRELDWLWQSLGRSKERLDQPRDQQVCPGPVLRPSVTSSLDTHTFKYCCHYSILDATYSVAQESENVEGLVFVPSKGPLHSWELAEHWPVWSNLSRASATHALLASVHLYKVMLRWLG